MNFVEKLFGTAKAQISQAVGVWNDAEKIQPQSMYDFKGNPVARKYLIWGGLPLVGMGYTFRIAEWYPFITRSGIKWGWKIATEGQILQVEVHYWTELPVEPFGKRH